ncbi:exported hypothetical protein [Candidatus Zixiibacteriota bacterium]|nr:exported hypothetical protein [candidate division Zixibacteria bacterium]
MKLSASVSVILLILTLTSSPLFAQIPDSGSEPPPGLTPAQLHTIMGQAKAEQVTKFRQAMSMATPMLYNQTDYDVNYYRIELKVNVPSQILYGNVSMAAKSLVNGLDTVGVDFDATLTIDSVYLPSGQRLNYSFTGYSLTVQLDKTYNLDETFEFTVRYHGTPQTGGFQGFFFTSRNGIPVVTSLSEPYLAHTWWPCKDRSDDKADSLDIFVTCDTALYCASNGTLIDTTRHGDGTWTFNYQVRYPIATYLFSVAMSKYTVFEEWYHYGPSDSMPIVYHVYPDQYATALTNWQGITPYALSVYSGLFGQYPFVREKYGHANFQWGGGMEHQTCTSLSGGWFGFYEPVVVHELSHQWWGDMITCNNWHEIWLNEGFASYCEALYYEVKNGDAAYHSYMTGMDFTGGGSIYIYDTTNVDNIFGNIVYDKAAWVLHMLRHIVGDDTFFNILRDYYSSAYQYKDVTTEQFKNLCESISGKDLDYFFQEWIYGTYRPRYVYTFMSELDPTDNKYWNFLYVEQGQTTPPSVFSMPVDFLFTYGPGDTATQNLFNDSKRTTYIVKTDKAATDITLDPEVWILKAATKSNWTMHIIPFPLDSGEQYQSYEDSIVSRGGSGTNTYSLLSGTFPSGLLLDANTGVIFGTPTNYGTFSFKIKAKDQYSSYADSIDFSMTIAKSPFTAGDADNNGIINILDVAFLINYLYKSGAAPAIMNQADPDRNCTINILDVSYLINYLYKSGPVPLLGCVS